MSDEIKFETKTKLNKKLIIGAVAVIAIALVAVLAIILPKSVAAKKLEEQLNLGNKYLSELQYEQAKVAYLAVIEIDPKNVDAYLGLTEVYIAQGEYDMAIEVLEDALKELSDEDAEIIADKLEEAKALKEAMEVTQDEAPTSTPMPDEHIETSTSNVINPPTTEPATTNPPTTEPTATNSPTPIIPEGITISDELVELENAYVGAYVKYGTYEQDNDLTNGQEEIEWLVLDIQDGNALLLSRYILDKKAYNDKWITWKKSAVREWLNEDFYSQAFSDEEKACIEIKEVLGYLESTLDKVTLLSDYETGLYFSSDEERVCYATLYAREQDNGESIETSLNDAGACSWWKLITGYYEHCGIVTDDGDNNRIKNYLTSSYVRPAVVIDEKLYPGTSGNLTVGNVITLGYYEQDNNLENGAEPIEWLVLNIEEGKVLLVSKYALHYMSHEEQRITWENSTIRNWLNTNFLSTAFTYTERLAIRNTMVNNPAHPLSGIDGGNSTTDKVFLCSIDEVQKYFPMNSNAENELRMTIGTDYANKQFRWSSEEWILRSPGQNYYGAAMVSDNNGMIYGVYDPEGGRRSSGGDAIFDDVSGIRPAMWININTAMEATNEQEVSEVQFTGNVVEPKNAEIGDSVYFGTFEQDNDHQNGREKIEWLVLDIVGGKALLLSKYGLDVQAFQSDNEKSATWKESTVRQWLNGEFFAEAFADGEKNNIIKTQVLTQDYFEKMSNGGHKRGDAGGITTDSVFLLSREEAELYFPKDVNYENLARQVMPTAYAIANGAKVYSKDEWQHSACDWWLRSVGEYGENAFISRYSGLCDSGYASREAGIRPAIWISIE